MDVETVRNYCILKPGVSESFPFDQTTLVFKVGSKMFALLSLDSNFTMNLKCDPGKAIELRESYSCVLPGYHQNKTHWNTIVLGELPKEQLLFQWIDHSYELVFNSLTIKEKSRIKN